MQKTLERNDPLNNPKKAGAENYNNIPMQYTAIFHGSKNDYFQMKKKKIFVFFFALNIDRGYTLGSNEYPQSMF